MASKRGGFGGDPLHHAPIACEAKDLAVEEGVIVSIEFRGEKLQPERHSDGVSDSLAQRTGGRFNAVRHAIFGMARRD